MPSSFGKNIIKETTDIILSESLKYAQRYGLTIGNILSLEKVILLAVSLLTQKKQQVLYALLQTDESVLYSFKLRTNNSHHIRNLIYNLTLFNHSGNLQAVFLSKLLEEFLYDCGYRMQEDVEDVFETESITGNTFGYQANQKFYENDLYYYGNWGFGSRNKKRLGLSSEQANLLNKVEIGGTVFTRIRQCADESALLFLRVIKGIEKAYLSKGLDFFKTIDKLGRNVYYGYDYGFWESPANRVFHILFKFSENGVREQYGHKRKLEEKTHIINLEEYLRDIFIGEIKEIIKTEREAIAAATQETLIELNAINKTNWKRDFEEIKEKINVLGTKQAIQKLDLLYELNAKNDALYKIYFEASKLLIAHHKMAALKAYLNYYHRASKMKGHDLKFYTKRQVKELFSKEDQLTAFNQIVQKLSSDKDIQAAISNLPSVYAVKRKKVKLDDQAINRINEMHTETVEQLGQVLDEPGEITKKEPDKKPTQEVEILEGLADIFETDDAAAEPIEFNKYQRQFINLLIENDLFLPKEAVDKFAKANGVFKNQLINGINEVFYEQREDNLLEEQEGGCKMIEEYIDEVKS